MDNWVELQDETGRAYFFNEALNETAWELPAGASLEVDSGTGTGAGDAGGGAGEGWERVLDPASGRYYYANLAGETSWERPEGMAEGVGDTDVDTLARDGGVGDWLEVVGEGGEVYFYNAATEETRWDINDADADADADSDADSGADDGAAVGAREEWEELVDESSGNTYYFNPTLGVTQWEKPATSVPRSGSYADAGAGVDGEDGESLANASEQGQGQKGQRKTGMGQGGVKISGKHVSGSSSPTASVRSESTTRAGIGAGAGAGAGAAGFHSPRIQGTQVASGGGDAGRSRGGSADSAYSALSDDELQSDLSPVPFTPSSPLASPHSAQAQGHGEGQGQARVGMSLYDSAVLNLPPLSSGQGMGVGTGAGGGMGLGMGVGRGKRSYASAPDVFLADFLSHSGVLSGSKKDTPGAGNQGLSEAGGAGAGSRGFGGWGGGGIGGIGGMGGSEDLSEVQKTALVLLDSIEPSTPALRCADILLSPSSTSTPYAYTSAFRSPYLLSQLARRLSPHNIEKYAESYFYYDRRAHMHHPTSTMEPMLCYQSEPLKHSLTAAPAPALQSEALWCFQLVCAFMGKEIHSHQNPSQIQSQVQNPSHHHSQNPSQNSQEKPSQGASRGGGAGGMCAGVGVEGGTRIDLAVTLLHKLIRGSPELQEEAYCQICKQVRKNPNPDSVELGWQLMLLVLACIPPSRRFLPYLISYIAATLAKMESANAGAGAGLGVGAGTLVGVGASTTTAPAAGTSTGTESDVDADAGAGMATATSTGPGSGAGAGAGTGASVVGSSVGCGAGTGAVCESLTTMKFVLLSLRACLPAALASVRAEVPTRGEIRALLVGEGLDVQVHTLEASPLSPLSLPPSASVSVSGTAFTLMSSANSSTGNQGQGSQVQGQLQTQGQQQTQGQRGLCFSVDSYTTMGELLGKVCSSLQLKEGNRPIFALFEEITEITSVGPQGNLGNGNPGNANIGNGTGQGTQGQGHEHNHGHGANTQPQSHLQSLHVQARVVQGLDSALGLGQGLRVADWLARCERNAAQYGVLGGGGMGQGHGAGQGMGQCVGAEGRQGQEREVVERSLSHCLICKARFMYRLSEHGTDPVTMRLLYAQALQDVLSARYMHTLADALVLASFVLQETLGDFVQGTRSLAEIKGNLGLSLSKLVSPSVLELVGIGEYDNPGNLGNSVKSGYSGNSGTTGTGTVGASRSELEGKILATYKTLAGTSAAQARRMFLAYVGSWKVFGANFFVVGQVENAEEIVLSISVSCILLINPVSTHFIAEYAYADVLSWGHSFDSFVLITGTKSSQVKAYFKSSQGREIDALVRVYHEKFRESGGQGGGGGSGLGLGSGSGSGGGGAVGAVK